jgi:hypothetical protein
VETFSGIATPKRSTLLESQQLYRIWLLDLEHCHRLGMWTNCQRQVAAATAPSSGAASLMICVSFMTLVSVTALVAIPLLSLPATGHGILAIGMSITLPLVFDQSLLPAPSYWVRGRAPLLCSYCLPMLLFRLGGYLLTQSYCWTTVIVSR